MSQVSIIVINTLGRIIKTISLPFVKENAYDTRVHGKYEMVFLEYYLVG